MPPRPAPKRSRARARSRTRGEAGVPHRRAQGAREQDPRPPRGDASRRHLRAALPQPLRAGGGDDPLRAVHRRAREPGDAAALRALPHRRRPRGRARPEDVEEIIKPTGFFRAKTKSLLGNARGLVERHGGEVPRTMAEMVKLPGVGRKTASVVLGHVYGINEGIAVDTHVLRVGNRLGIAAADDPLVVEQQLMAMIPRERWTQVTDVLIFHGRAHLRRAAAALRPVPGLRAVPMAEPPGVRDGPAAEGSTRRRRARPGAGRAPGRAARAR